MINIATKAHLEGNKRYLATKVDEIKLRVPKGRKAELQELAAQSGDSLNAFIIKAIDAYINRAEE